MISYQELPRPAIFAHRGSSAHAPENTLAAFELALQHECDGIELDVMLSGDGQIVVIHDNNLIRTTGFKGNVAELPVSQIKQLDAGSYFDVEYRNQKIPLLEEVFEQFGKRTFINIELKNYQTIFDNLPELVSKMVERFNLQHSILFSSFNPFALINIKRRLPRAITGLLALPGNAGWLARSWAGWALTRYDAIHPEKQDTTRKLIKHAHANSKRVHAYTVNTFEELVRLFELNIDGIFTDDPLAARMLLTGQYPGASIPE